jgi:hypothetical protein
MTNIRRGFFRVWIILSLGSLAFTVIDSYSEIARAFGQRAALIAATRRIEAQTDAAAVAGSPLSQVSHDIPVKCNLAKGKIGTDFDALDKDTPPPPDGFELSQQSSDDLISGNICWYHPIKFRKFFPSYNDLSDDELRATLYRKADIRFTRSLPPTSLTEEHRQQQEQWPNPWKVLSTTICNAAIFPLIMLGLWFGGCWIVAGFRNKNL